MGADLEVSLLSSPREAALGKLISYRRMEGLLTGANNYDSAKVNLAFRLTTKAPELNSF